MASRYEFDDDAIGEDLTQAFEQVQNERSYVLSNLLDEIKKLEENELDLKADSIYEYKVEEYLKNKANGLVQPIESENEKADLEENINLLEMVACENKFSLYTMKNIAHNVQMRDMIADNIKRLDPELTRDTTQELIEKNTTNNNLAEQIVQLLNKIDEVKLNILRNKKREAELAQKVKMNFIRMERKHNDGDVELENNDQLQDLKIRTIGFEKQVWFLSMLIQGMFTDPDSNWAYNPRIVQTLLICEKLSSGPYSIQEVEQDFEKLHSLKDKVVLNP